MTTDERILGILADFESQIRGLEYDLAKLREQVERLSGDVVYLEGAIG